VGDPCRFRCNRASTGRRSSAPGGSRVARITSRTSPAPAVRTDTVSTQIRSDAARVGAARPRLRRRRDDGHLPRPGRQSVTLRRSGGDVGHGAAQVLRRRCLGRRGRSSACRAVWREMNASRSSLTVARSVSSRNAVASKVRRSAWSSGSRGSSPKTRASVVHDRATASRRSAEGGAPNPRLRTYAAGTR
jgi:hypothetical protein